MRVGKLLRRTKVTRRVMGVEREGCTVSLGKPYLKVVAGDSGIKVNDLQVKDLGS